MVQKLVRLQVWVTPKQKAQVTKWAKALAKANRSKVSESEIVRAAIDYQVSLDKGH